MAGRSRPADRGRLAGASVLDFNRRTIVATGDFGMQAAALVLYPMPENYGAAAAAPEAARRKQELGEFLLPYEAVRSSADPEATLTTFLQSTYAAAADTGEWDRNRLECALGQPRQPRPVGAA